MRASTARQARDRQAQGALSRSKGGRTRLLWLPAGLSVCLTTSTIIGIGHAACKAWRSRAEFPVSSHRRNQRRRKHGSAASESGVVPPHSKVRLAPSLKLRSTSRPIIRVYPCLSLRLALLAPGFACGFAGQAGQAVAAPSSSPSWWVSFPVPPFSLSPTLHRLRHLRNLRLFLCFFFVPFPSARVARSGQAVAAPSSSPSWWVSFPVPPFSLSPTLHRLRHLRNLRLFLRLLTGC